MCIYTHTHVHTCGHDVASHCTPVVTKLVVSVLVSVFVSYSEVSVLFCFMTSTRRRGSSLYAMPTLYVFMCLQFEILTSHLYLAGFLYGLQLYATAS